MDFAEIKKKKQVAQRSVSILLDAQLASQIETLRQKIRTEERVDRRENRTPLAPKLQADLDSLVEKAEASKVTFTFKAIGRKQWDDLIVKHKPTKEQKDQGMAWNPDGFVPELMALSCVDPDLNIEQAEEIWESDDWSGGELLSLMTAAITVNQEKPDIPFGVGSTVVTDLSNSNLITAASEESLTDVS